MSVNAARMSACATLATPEFSEAYRLKATPGGVCASNK
jgi:hypothetical protein